MSEVILWQCDTCGKRVEPTPNPDDGIYRVFMPDGWRIYPERGPGVVVWLSKDRTRILPDRHFCSEQCERIFVEAGRE